MELHSSVFSSGSLIARLPEKLMKLTYIKRSGELIWKTVRPYANWWEKRYVRLSVCKITAVEINARVLLPREANTLNSSTFQTSARGKVRRKFASYSFNILQYIMHTTAVGKSVINPRFPFKKRIINDSVRWWKTLSESHFNVTTPYHNHRDGTTEKFQHI